MKTCAILATLVASASAFAPASQSARTSVAKNALIDDTFGISIETGNKCPPLGRAILETANENGIKWWQNAELKNGRVAMVATIGYMVQKWHVHMPLYLGPSGSNVFNPDSSKDWLLSSTTGVTFSDIAKADPLDAIGMIPSAGLVQILFAAGLFELTAWKRQWNDGDANTIPGDYGYDPLGFTKREGGWDSAELKKLRMMEIKNGRVAMMAMAGWLSEESIPGSFPVWVSLLMYMCMPMSCVCVCLKYLWIVHD